MSPVAKQITDMVYILPENDQNLVYELVKRMVLAWDPDFTKVTPEESEAIDRSFNEIQRGECIHFESVGEMATYFGVQ
jgi:hypothetical protein